MGKRSRKMQRKFERRQKGYREIVDGKKFVNAKSYRAPGSRNVKKQG